MLKASTRACVVGGQGAGLSTISRCYPPFFLEVGHKRGGVTAVPKVKVVCTGIDVVKHSCHIT